METLVTPVSTELQTLIETRLDLVDRVLLDARVSRAERTGILQELEAQILEQLDRRTTSPTREDVLAVLAELDPPEAFLAEGHEDVAIRPQRSSGRFTATSSPKTTTSPSGLSLWAGWLVAGTALLTASLLSTAVWIIPEFVLGFVAVIQLAALTGAALGAASLLRSSTQSPSGLERIVAGAAAATGALTLVFLLILGSLLMLDGGSEILLWVVAGFVGGAWIHGAWLAAATCALWLRPNV